VFVFFCVTYCQVLFVGLNLSDTSGLMKLSCFEDVAIKDSDLIYIKVAIYDSNLICLQYARVHTWEYNKAGGGPRTSIVMQSHRLPQ